MSEIDDRNLPAGDPETGHEETESSVHGNQNI